MTTMRVHTPKIESFTPIEHIQAISEMSIALLNNGIDEIKERAQQIKTLVERNHGATEEDR